MGNENILGGTVLPSEEKFLILTESSRLLTLPLGNLESLSFSPDDETPMETVGSDLTLGGLHRAPVIGADVAQQRSIIVTISQDHTTRVWNFESMKCELVHDFRSEDLSAISVFYTGFQVSYFSMLKSVYISFSIYLIHELNNTYFMTMLLDIGSL